jgi:hypothetical protein
MNQRLGTVVTYMPGSVDDHQRATVADVARKVAALMDWDFGGEFDVSARSGQRLYFVPNHTLLTHEARVLRIRHHDDLFGGVVPFPFVATKAIVHPLISPDASRPPGWSHDFPERVRDTVLPGFTAFSLRDARRAATKLLVRGPIRLKPGRGIGGRGQRLVSSPTDLDARLRGLTAADLEREGVGIELDLAEATTYSIGQIRVAGLEASYCGTQSTTTDNTGATAFGGSDIVVVRGSFDALAELPLEPGAHLAIEQARAFDAATVAFSGLFASRRNYDAVRGRDAAGRVRSGVLEQSWRLGGASGPEIAALAALRTHPALHAVRARSVERYGSTSAPAHAIVHFSGVDRRLGTLTKYTTVEPYEPAR